MKSVKLSYDNYFDIEQIIKKIAEENNINNISKININLTKDAGYVKFAVIDDWESDKEDPAEKDATLLKEMMYDFQIDAVTAEKIIELTSSLASYNTAEEIMKEINDLIEGHGVEAIRKEGVYIDSYYFDTVATFVNTGDMYNATIVHDSDTGEFSFTTYADFVEKWEREHPEESEEDEYDEEE
jgi:hypothetical protein